MCETTLEMPTWFPLIFVLFGWVLCSLVWALSILLGNYRRRRDLTERLDRLCALVAALMDSDVALRDMPLLRRYLVEGAAALGGPRGGDQEPSA